MIMRLRKLLTSAIQWWDAHKNFSLSRPNPTAGDTMSKELYKSKYPIEPWDYTVANNLDYFQGTIVKYITRWKDKNGMEDLEKAKDFLNKYMEVLTNDAERHKTGSNENG